MQWTAIYENGEKLKEFDDEGNENHFRDIERDRVKRFILSNEDEEYTFKTINGHFFINGKPLIVSYKPTDGEEINLTGNSKDLIQFKEAHSDATMNSEGKMVSLGTVIDSHNIGYKRKIELDDMTFHFKPIVKRYNEDKVYLQINLSSDTEINGFIEIEYGDKTDRFQASFSRPEDGGTIPAGQLNYKL